MPQNTIQPYPCDAGTSRPMGYHQFQASPNGVVVCALCGQYPQPRLMGGRWV